MGGAAGIKKQFESVLGGGALEWQGRSAPEMVSSGVPEVDRATGGLPRGCLTEIFGAASSGRTSLLVAILAAATARVAIDSSVRFYWQCTLIFAALAISSALFVRFRS